MIALDALYIESVVKAALDEDIGSGDITTLLTIPEDAMSTGMIVAKGEGFVAGMEVAKAAFGLLDSDVVFEMMTPDGTPVVTGEPMAMVTGKARALLTAERVALNFLQRLSGVATTTGQYVALVAHTDARIVDTRKTTPGLRRLEKYAVTVGGGHNHRFGLSDGILIKDNHIAAVGGITEAVSAAKTKAPHTMKIEVEVTSLEQLEEALAAGADAALLDNMDVNTMQKAVELVAGRILLEASGGVNQETVADIAETGVDIISVGSLTHSPKAMDISLNFADIDDTI